VRIEIRSAYDDEHGDAHGDEHGDEHGRGDDDDGR
jgi:hypothetical protein